MDRDILFAVRQELIEGIDEKTRDGASRFFKEEVRFYGVKGSLVRRIAAKYLQELKGEEKSEIFTLCESLLRSDYGEEASIAFEWAHSLRRQYEPSDFYVFERWLKQYVNNWAKCDTLCNHALGSLIEMYPQFVEDLFLWARSDNRWVRRGSAVTLILPARRGDFLPEVFMIADILLEDKDDLVQKGYGWLLKEASRTHQDQVFEYVMRNKAVMPRTALRYAIEKMPEELRRKAMER
ncbi:DNA alkylation repair protein [Methanothrix sp.]|uniref:DNA alkylation repair protein n=1 Tax=Methanothrix sp. TaxID=90426 RepID=UPI003C72C816